MSSSCSSDTKIKRALICAGGTGGHVFPAIATALWLQDKGYEISWMASKYGMESHWVPKQGFNFYQLSIRGLRGKNIIETIKSLCLAGFSLVQAYRIIRRVKPDIVLGMGGYPAGPGGLMAWLLRKPLVIHEQNSVLGLTNRLLAPLANRCLSGFEGVFPARFCAISTGNPVRAELLADDFITKRARQSLNTRPMRILVLGGSQGARALNQYLPEALSLFKEEERPCVWHQAGSRFLEQSVKSYSEQGLKLLSDSDVMPQDFGQVLVAPFIDDMKKAYSWADWVICRAGALTVAELSAVGLGALLVPFPYAVDDHQTKNAEYLVNNKAAVLMAEADITSQSLYETIFYYQSHPKERLEMGKRALALGHSEATKAVGHICIEESNV